MKDVRRFEKEFLDYVEHRHKGIYDAITSSGQLSDETAQSLEQAIGDFKKTFDTSTGESLVKDEKVDAMEAGEEGQEKVTAHRQQKPPESTQPLQQG